MGEKRNELYYVKRWMVAGCILLVYILCTGCANRSVMDVDNEMRVWGHETAHCVHNYFHPEGYDRTTWDFTKQERKTFTLIVHPYETREEYEAEYLKHRGTEAASYKTGFYRDDSEGCHIYVPALKPAGG